MKINEIATLYKNIFEEGTAKGSFFITDNGLMAPRTRNVTLWGLAHSLSIPEEYRKNPNIVTALKEQLPTSSDAPIPAFFKFQKSTVSVFTEAIAMEIATHFSTKTCFNYPANLDKSPNSLYQAVSPYLDTKTEFGNMVFSFLGRDEELITFYKIANAQEMTTDVMTLTELVPQFIAKALPHLSPEKTMQTVSHIQKDYAYQYLLRDFLGDIDFTSKNSGIIVNPVRGYATIAPNFDFGEVMNSLVANKFSPPKLDSIENYSEAARQFITQESIDKFNAIKLAKYNCPVSEYAKRNTFEDRSDININFICQAFPTVAQKFSEDLENFMASGLIPEIIGKYSGEDNLITAEQAEMSIDYLQQRGAIFSEKLEDNLALVPGEKRYAYDEELYEEIIPDNASQQANESYLTETSIYEMNNSDEHQTEQITDKPAPNATRITYSQGIINLPLPDLSL